MIATKLFPWHLAQARRAFVFAITIPLQTSAIFWTTWAEVYRPGR